MSLLVRNCASDTTTRDYVTLCPITDYDWPALESPIIDIGGGIGSLELALAKECSESPFQFVIFDIPETIVNAKKASIHINLYPEKLSFFIRYGKNNHYL